MNNRYCLFSRDRLKKESVTTYTYTKKRSLFFHCPLRLLCYNESSKFTEMRVYFEKNYL